MLKVVFTTTQISYPFAYLPLKWNISAFFSDFFICVVSFYIYKSWILSYEFMLSKGKNFEEMCDTYLFRFTFLPLHANSPSSGGFSWRQNCCLWFLRCLPFSPCHYFDYQGILSFASDFHSNLWRFYHTKSSTIAYFLK